MESIEQQLDADLKLLNRAIQTLKEALSTEPFILIVRDAAIQRFEYSVDCQSDESII